MAAGDLDFRLLLAIMKYLGENRDIYPNWVATEDLIELIPTEKRDTDQKRDMNRLDRHLVFLEARHYVTLGVPRLIDSNRAIRLTDQGEIFVQPELSQLDDVSMLPQVFDAIERQILTYPDDGKRHGFLFDLKGALAKNAPDIVAKLLVEVLPKLGGGAP